MNDQELAILSEAPQVGTYTDFYDVWIGRAGQKPDGEHSEWANPFSVVELGREAAIEHYEEYIRNRPDLLAKIPELRGKLLACVCRDLDHPNGAYCHGDILVKLYLEWSREMLKQNPDYFKKKDKT